MKPLIDALGGMVAIPRFFVWRLRAWNGAKWKDKAPWGLAGIFDARAACLAGELLSYGAANEWLQRCRAGAGNDEQFTLGWYVMPDAGYWCVDIDSCVSFAADGSPLLNDVASAAFAALPGVMGEYSSSMRGLHFFGRGALPDGHKVRGKGMPDGMELYSRERGIAFGLSGQAWGSADVQCVPPWIVMGAADDAPSIERAGGRMAKWRGPENDDELIAKMLARREGALMLRGGVTLRQLWEGDAAAISRHWPDAADKGGRCSEADAALASHLAWWTGADVERMLRLMWRSGLVRDKWSDSRHRNYVVDTCTNAAAACTDCYVLRELPQLPPPPPPATVPPAVLGVLDAARGSTAAMEVIARAGNVDELQECCSQVAAMGPWNKVEIETLAQRLSRKAKEISGEKWPIALCRKMVSDGAMPDAGVMTDAARPDWVDEWVYLSEPGKYCHVDGAFALLSRDSIHVTLCNKPEVPYKPNGERMDVHKLLSEVWGVEVCHDLGYCPTAGMVYQDGGRKLLNTFYGSMPDPEPYDPAIAADYIQHLRNVCNGDETLTNHLLYWMAHHVQRPGVLIRWAVLIIGAGGTGKTTTHKQLMRALGRSNVKVSSAAAVNNKGGFMDWAARSQVLGILEDFSITGPDRFATYEAIKPVISDDWVTATRKGVADVTYRNYAGYFANSNRHDAIPVSERDDRRWLVILTTQLDARVREDKDGLAAELKYLNEQRFDRMSDGAWRAFFESVQIPAEWYTANVRAPSTTAMRTMQAAAESDVQVAIAELIGGADVIAPHPVMSYLRAFYKYTIKDERALPKTTQIKHIFQELGYVIADERKVKINGIAQRVYTKNNSLNWLDTTTSARQFAENCAIAEKGLLASVFH